MYSQRNNERQPYIMSKNLKVVGLALRKVGKSLKTHQLAAEHPAEPEELHRRAYLWVVGPCRMWSFTFSLSGFARHTT